MLNLTKKSSRSARAALVAVVAAASSAAQAAFTVTNIGDLLAAQGYGATYGSTPLGLNQLGQVVGFYNSAASFGSQVPYVYSPNTGVLSLSQVAPYFTTQANAINDSGIVVGDGGATPGGDLNAFVYDSTTQAFSYISPSVVSNGVNTPVATNFSNISNSGLAIGYVGYAAQSSTNTGTRAFRGLTYNTLTGAAADVGTPFSGPTVVGNLSTNQNIVQGVNNFGVLVGSGPNTGGTSGTAAVNNTRVYYRATPSSGGTYSYTDLTPLFQAADPQYSGTSASGIFIDDLGNISGNYILSSATNRRGFLYDASTGVSVTIGDASTKPIINGITDINGSPVLFGSTQTTGGYTLAMIYQNGSMVDISGALAGTAYSAYTLTEAKGLNANGDLIAVGRLTGSSAPTSFLLTGFLPVSGVSVLRIPNFSVTAGTRTLESSAPADVRRLLISSDISISGGALDLGKNDVILSGGGDAGLALLTGYLAQGYNAAGGGNWSGSTGITSSVAAADASHLTGLGIILNSNGAGGTIFSQFDGVPVSATDVLVKYTYFGDTDLNGWVDGADLANLLAGMSGGLSGWANGDFNYDGKVDSTDLNLLLASLSGQTTPFGNGGGGGTGGAVPEPTSLAPIAASTFVLLMRKRRSSDAADR